MKCIGRVAPIVLAALFVVATAMAADPTSRGLSSTDQEFEKPTNTGTPPAPDPNVIMQGGDTCADATVIPSLPYSDTGTTIGLTDDLQPATCSSAGGAPDAVYVYTPSVNQVITVSLCTATDYDSTVYVLQGACPGPEIACNDDDCGLQSQIASVSVTAGTPYYIIIDGFSSAAGNYSLDVTETQPPPPPPDCPPDNTLYGQPPHGPEDSWSAATSGEPSWANYTVYDGFSSDLYSITDVHWWGLSLLFTGAWNPCDPTGMTFDIRFYADSAGQPGTEICAYTGVAPTMVDSGLLYSGFPLYYWEITGLTPACQPTGATWMSVKSLANTNDCSLLWMSSPIGNAASWQLDQSTGGYTLLTYDMSMCLTGVIVPVELQSFDIE